MKNVKNKHLFNIIVLYQQITSIKCVPFLFNNKDSCTNYHDNYIVINIIIVQCIQGNYEH